MKTTFMLDAAVSGGAVVVAIAFAHLVGCVGDDPVSATASPDGSVVTVVEDGGGNGGPTGAALGAPCTRSDECASSHCADGVCCDTACSGVCESCALATAGTCSPIPVNTDPDHECANVKAADAGADADVDADAQAEGGLAIPDGGSLDLAACAGSCNGQRACEYPTTSTGCGPAFCQSTAATPTSFHCDGRGGCASSSASCTAYACEDGACRTSCAGNADCQASSWCNASNQCSPKKDDGLLCTLPAECKSGYCVQGVNARVCCASSCNDTGMQCDVSGKEGSCSCGGLTCANGCRLFYVDADGDGHGDPTGTIANQRAVAGCTGTATMTGPMVGKTYRPNNDDCDDLDANAFPGQTQFFATANPRIGFDYDCNGSTQKELPEWPGMTCKVCTLTWPLACSSLNDCGSQCCGNAHAAGFRCGFACPNGAGGYACCPLPFNPLGSKEGFEVEVACGASADYHVCGYCNAEPNNTPAVPIDKNTGSKTQRCH